LLQELFKKGFPYYNDLFNMFMETVDMVQPHDPAPPTRAAVKLLLYALMRTAKLTYTVFSRKMAARSGQVPDRNKTTYTFEMNITVTDYNILFGLPAKTLADIMPEEVQVIVGGQNHGGSSSTTINLNSLHAVYALLGAKRDEEAASGFLCTMTPMVDIRHNDGESSAGVPMYVNIRSVLHICAVLTADSLCTVCIGGSIRV
jgi:hypothetical protein